MYLQNFIDTRSLRGAVLIWSYHHKCSTYICHVVDDMGPWPNITFPRPIKVTIRTGIEPPTTVILRMAMSEKSIVLIVC